MILLIGDISDPHLIRVAQELELLGVSSRTVNLADLGLSVAASVEIATARRHSFQLVGPDWDFALEDIEAAWIRRRRPLTVTAAVPDPDDRNFAQSEWRATIDGIIGLIDPRRVINPPSADRAARSKIHQLAVAREKGWAIPETLVTSSPDAARAFVGRHGGRVIHKSLTAPNHVFMETRRWAQDDFSHLELLPLAPIFLQEEILGVADLRVTVVGAEIFAARIPPEAGGAVDSRLDLGQPYEAFECPAECADRVRSLCIALGLVVCTIDLKLLASGDCVFFEVNPQGQFLYVEIMTGQPIIENVARTLAAKAAL